MQRNEYRNLSEEEKEAKREYGSKLKNYFLHSVKMSYYWFNKKELLKKLRDKYQKVKKGK